MSQQDQQNTGADKTCTICAMSLLPSFQFVSLLCHCCQRNLADHRTVYQCVKHRNAGGRWPVSSTERHLLFSIFFKVKFISKENSRNLNSISFFFNIWLVGNKTINYYEQQPCRKKSQFVIVVASITQ